MRQSAGGADGGKKGIFGSCKSLTDSTLADTPKYIGRIAKYIGCIFRYLGRILKYVGRIFRYVRCTPAQVARREACMWVIYFYKRGVEGRGVSVPTHLRATSPQSRRGEERAGRIFCRTGTPHGHPEQEKSQENSFLTYQPRSVKNFLFNFAAKKWKPRMHAGKTITLKTRKNKQ